MILTKTRGQRPNESQKAVIVDKMKSVGENSIKDVASCLVFNPFWENFDHDLFTLT